MRLEGSIFLIIGIILCIIGIYLTEWLTVLLWIGGLLMIIISVAIMFPQKKGLGIE